MLNKLRNGTDSFLELFIIYLVSASTVAILFSVFEGRGLVDGYWWTFITGLTIGYGDIYPVTLAGKILTVIWAHFMVLILVPLFIGRILVVMIRNKDEFTHSEQEEVKGLLRKLVGKK